MESFVDLIYYQLVSSIVCIEATSKRAQQESGEGRVTDKSRPMMNLTARTPSFVSSSASANPHLWHNQCVQDVLSVTQATVTKLDRCQFGSLNADNIGLKRSHEAGS